MIDTQQDIQLTLRGIDAASPAIRDVQAALERLGQLNLAGTVGQLDALGRGLDQVGAQAQLLGERFDAMSSVVKAAMAQQTAEVQAQTARVEQALKAQATALQGSMDRQVQAIRAGGQDMNATLGATFAEAQTKTKDFWAQYAQLAQEGADKAAQAAARAQAQLASAQASAAKYAGGSSAGGTAATRGGASGGEATPGLFAERGLLGEKGPVGGATEIPGVDLAQQFLIWGTVFSLYSRATQAAGQLASALFTTNASFQETGATLSAIYGGDGPAQRALAWMDSFAESTPYTRDQVRQAGIAFAAQGDDITGALTAAGNLSSAMHNVGGIMDATRGIVDAQNNQFRILRDELHVTTAELEPFGLKMEKSGHVVSSTVLPAIEAFVKANFPDAMAKQMETLPGMFSNLQDIVTEGLRHAGAGAYGAVQSWFDPIAKSLGDFTKAGAKPGAGLAQDTGGLFTGFANQVGQGLGQLTTTGLSALSVWFDKVGGMSGVITTVQQAWISFTSALSVGLSIVQGVGDALGNVFSLLREMADGVGRLLAPIQAVFGLFGGSTDTLRTVTATIVTMALELKVLATVYDLASTTLARFTGVLAANTAAQEANAVASGTAAAAAGTAEGLQMGAALRNMTIGLPGAALGAARSAGSAVASAAAPVGAGLTSLALFGDSALLLSTLGGGISALSEAIVGAIGPLGVFLADMYLVPTAFSDVVTFVQTLRGIDVKGLQTDLTLGVPTRYRIPPHLEADPGAILAGPYGGPPPIEVPGVERTGPGTFAHFLRTKEGPEAYTDWAEFVQHQRPGDFISYLQRLPQAQMEQIAREYGKEGGTGGGTEIKQIALGQAPGLRPEQQANVYTLFNRAIAQTLQDVAEKTLGRQNLQGDVTAQIEAYTARYKAQHPEATPQQIGVATDAYGIPLYKQYGLPLPTVLGKPKGAATGASQDQLDAIVQATQKVVGWDEVLQVPYQKFKKDMDAAMLAMSRAGDPEAEVAVFYKQHTDAWAKAAAQISQQTLQLDVAMGRPYAVIQRDMNDLAAKLKAEGDSNAQIAAQLGQAVDGYFQGLISQVRAQSSALATIGAPEGTQLAAVGSEQALMRQENAALARRGLAPKYSAQEIAAAGITGRRQIEAPFLQQTLQGAQDALDLAQQGGQITSTGQLQSYVAAIVAAQQAQLINQGTPPAIAARQAQIAGQNLLRQGQSTLLGQQQSGAQTAYDLALQRGQVTQLSQIGAYVAPIVAAHVAGLINQGTPRAQATAEGQLQQLQLIKQGQDAVLAQRKDQLTFDLNAHAQVTQLHKDEQAALDVIAAESGRGSLTYKLAKQQMDQQIAGSAGGGAARPPEPHYGVYGSLTATGATYGQSVVSFGTQMAHDPWAAIVSALREQVAHLKEQLAKDDALLAAANKTAINTGATASSLQKLALPPFPTTPATGAALPRISGAHTPIRRP